MSFLDMHDLATVVAQFGIDPLLFAWSSEIEELLGAAAALAAIALRPGKAKGRR